MSTKIKELLKEVGTDVSGKWVSVDNAEKLAKLMLTECCRRLGEETIRHDGYGYNQHELYNRLRNHFGVEE